MIIVGLTGSIGSGKTTFADYLAEQVRHSGHWESWQLVAEVADELRRQDHHPDPVSIPEINKWLEPLPAIVEKTCHVQADFKQIRLSEAALREAPENYDKLLRYLELVRTQPELASGKITENNKEKLRSILQWLGGYLAKKCGGDIWYSEIIRRIQSQPELELATIGGVRFIADAVCVKAVNGKIIAIRRPIKARDLNDLTERERALIKVDATVHNDSGLPELEACARQVVGDLQADILAGEYRASDNHKH